MTRPEDAALVGDIEREWAAVGLTGSLVARELTTGRELAFGAEEVWPLASVVKLPLAALVLEAFATGELAPDRAVDLNPDERTGGPSGFSLFRHPTRAAVEDLLVSSLAVSDNAATDALIDLLGPDSLTDRLRALGVTGVTVRHPMRALYGTAAAVRAVGLAVAGRAAGPEGSHVVDELALDRANVGTARALVHLLEMAWADRLGSHGTGPRLRELLGHQLVRHRLGAELASDATSVRSKTGTFLDLRHEAGVVETASRDKTGRSGRAGGAVAIAVLTRTSVPAAEQIEADLAIGHAARLAVEQVRRSD